MHLKYEWHSLKRFLNICFVQKVVFRICLSANFYCCTNENILFKHSQFLYFVSKGSLVVFVPSSGSWGWQIKPQSDHTRYIFFVCNRNKIIFFTNELISWTIHLRVVSISNCILVTKSIKIKTCFFDLKSFLLDLG